MSSLKKVRTIIGATVADEMHHKSVYVLGGLAVLFIFMLRGCFDNDVTLNGQRLDGATIGWHASLIAFHLIAAAGIVVGILLGMRTMTRDAESGTMVAILARPVRRIDYLIGKVVGVWLLAYGCTFVLHLTVYLIMLFKTGGRITLFIPCSLIVSLNVLFAVTAVLLLSRVVPDIVAALIGGAIWIVGYLSDAAYVAAQNESVRSILRQMPYGDQSVALWRIFWPKMTALQFYAASLIKDVPWHSPGPVHPAVNMAAFCVLAFLLLWIRFSREEIR